MNGSRQRSSAFSPWTPLAIWTALVFIGLPAGPWLWNGLKAVFPLAARLLPQAVLAAAAVTAVACIVRSPQGAFRRRKLSGLGAAALAVCIGFLIRYPAEPLHAAEYAVLALLARRAFRHRRPSTRAWFLSAVFALGVGTAEETLQLWVPGRVFDPRDLALNWCASFFGLLLSACMESGSSATNGRQDSP